MSANSRPGLADGDRAGYARKHRGDGANLSLLPVTTLPARATCAALATRGNRRGILGMSTTTAAIVGLIIVLIIIVAIVAISRGSASTSTTITRDRL